MHFLGENIWFTMQKGLTPKAKGTFQFRRRRRLFEDDELNDRVVDKTNFDEVFSTEHLERDSDDNVVFSPGS